nr:ribonuclease H-like domain-containing protein [Tanacetum cinerariifolium]
MTRYLLQKLSRAEEEIRVRSLPLDEPLNSFILQTLRSPLYLTFTRPDITYPVKQLFSYTTDSSIAYSDADWAGCPTTRRSTLGYFVFLSNNLLSWSSKRQPTLSRSSAEAEYRGVANAVAETCLIRNLLRELRTPLSSATVVYCDNDFVATGQVHVLHVPSRFQYADIFTKGLPLTLFDEFRDSMSLEREYNEHSNCHETHQIMPKLFSYTTDSLIAYSNADWAGCPTTRRSTLGYCVFLGNNLLSWSSKRQPTLSYSSAKAEYRGVANAVAETCWIRNLLRELRTPLSSATIVYCDNDLVATGQVRVLHVPSRFQYADIFTKGLPLTLFDKFRDSLSVRCIFAPTVREY